MTVRDAILMFRKSYEELPDDELIRLMRDYPLDRPEHIAANQLLEDRKEIKEERKHQELIEATKAKNDGGVHITSGGDTNIAGSNLAGRDLSQNASEGRDIKKVVIAIATGLVIGLIIAYLKGCFPAFLK